MKKIRQTPAHEDIAARAYELWEEAGGPTGRDEEFWLRAERQLQAEVVPPVLPSARSPSIPQSPAHAVPPVIQEVVQPVAHPPTPAPSRKRRAR